MANHLIVTEFGNDMQKFGINRLREEEKIGNKVIKIMESLDIFCE